MRKTALLSIFTSLAIILHAVEAWLPIPYVLPGAKLGLANIVAVYVLAVMDTKCALLVSVLRTTIGALLTGSFLTMGHILSLSGAFMSTLAMSLASRFNRDSSMPAFVKTNQASEGEGAFTCPQGSVNANRREWRPMLKSKPAKEGGLPPGSVQAKEPRNGGGGLSIIGVSVLGATVHNVTQLSVASAIVRHTGLLFYLPYLLLFAVPTGLLVGILTERLIIATGPFYEPRGGTH